MSLLYVIGILLVAGVLLWAVMAAPFIDAGIKRIIQIIVVVVAALWVISLFFPIGDVTKLRVGN
jgi:hypothetical protein